MKLIAFVPLFRTNRREKLALDCLAATGAATLGASWTRLFINGQPMGLYLMIDDATTSFVDNVLHGGDHSYPHTGKYLLHHKQKKK